MQELRLNLDCDLKVVKIIVFFGPCPISFYSFYVISLEETDVKLKPQSLSLGLPPAPVPTCFVDCNFFLQFNYINRNVSHLYMSDLQSWLSGQSVALNKREIASSDSSGVLLP